MFLLFYFSLKFSYFFFQHDAGCILFCQHKKLLSQCVPYRIRIVFLLNPVFFVSFFVIAFLAFFGA